jgi:hypothetical protein
MDGIIRNELTCRENKNNCILMEIKIWFIKVIKMALLL